MPMISGASPEGSRDVAQLLHHRLAIGHLRHVLGRDEADRVDVPESQRDQAREIANLFFRRNDVGKALPRIARAFDNGYGMFAGSADIRSAGLLS